MTENEYVKLVVQTAAVLAGANDAYTVRFLKEGNLETAATYVEAAELLVDCVLHRAKKRREEGVPTEYKYTPTYKVAVNA